MGACNAVETRGLLYHCNCQLVMEGGRRGNLLISAQNPHTPTLPCFKIQKYRNTDAICTYTYIYISTMQTSNPNLQIEGADQRIDESAHRTVPIHHITRNL